MKGISIRRENKDAPLRKSGFLYYYVSKDVPVPTFPFFLFFFFFFKKEKRIKKPRSIEAFFYIKEEFLLFNSQLFSYTLGSASLCTRIFIVL